MSLDNAVRGALVREGEAIFVDASAALPGVETRLRAKRRRRARHAVVAVLVAVVVAWAPEAQVVLRGSDVAPAQERSGADPSPHARPARSLEPARGRRGPEGPEHVRRSDEPDRGEASPTRGTQARDEAEAPPESLAPTLPLRRRIVEPYEISYVAGTHVGENAGTGCWWEGSFVGSNECIGIRIGDDETSIALRLLDDNGVVVGATVDQVVGGETTELVTFCGRTNGYVSVEPGAFVVVYIDSTDRCSKRHPGRGALFASIR